MRWSRILLVVGFMLLSISSANAAIVINEILSDPIGKEPDNEWIELYTDQTTNLANWSVSDAANHTYKFSAYFNSFAILACNSTAFNETHVNLNVPIINLGCTGNGWLNNGAESVFLYDDTKQLKDTYGWQSNPGENKSLARIPDGTGNFSVCIPTPGLPNACENQELPKPTPICGNGILEEGETSATCCADAGCPVNQSCVSNQCKFVADSESQAQIDNTTDNETAAEKETGPFSISILEIPKEAKQGENFTAEIEITNKFNETKTADVYSYVYSGSTLATEGGWTGNLQTLNLTAGESTVVNLTNKVKSDAILGNYSFKVRAVVDSKKYDATSAIEILENKNLGNLSTSESPKPQASSANSNHTASTDNSATGAFVWSSKSTPNAAILLFVGVLLIFVVVLLLMLLRKQNP